MVHSHFDVKSVLNEMLSPGGILGGMQCSIGDSSMLKLMLAYHKIFMVSRV
jgi:hypothetical protein